MDIWRNSAILVVDDREDNLFVIEQLICAYLAGCRVYKASNGRDGLQQARTRDIDVILSDLQMPVMDGIEFCEKIKNDPKTSHLPFVLMTAHSTDVQTRIRGLDVGADDFILKPMDNAELVARLKVMLRIKKAEDRLRGERDTLAYEVTRTAKELDEAENRYETLFNEAGDAIFIHGPEEPFLEVNHEALRLLGYSSEELYGLKPGQVFDHKYGNPWMGKMTENTVGGERFFFETNIRTKDNQLIPVEVNSRSIIYKGAPAILSVARDVAFRKEMEREKELLESQLRQSQKMEAIGTLAGGIAHDFNNLLQIINGYTQILLLDVEQADPSYHQLLEIQTAGERASKLVKQLLSFSRKTEIDRKPIDLNREIKQTAGILARMIPKMIDIELRLDNSLWLVNADVFQIGQVLLNLGGNAADAMPEGGRLIVETRNITISNNAANELSELTPGDYVMFVVDDSGQGMTSETLSHIFEPFYTTKDIGKGTGLGLASVWGVVKSHGGCITCESELGEGATFKIYLPAYFPEKELTEERKTEASQDKGHETILLVEDEDAIRDFVTQALKRFGYQVVSANSGERALSCFQKDGLNIGLVILDLGMPGMGGQKCFDEMLKLKPDVRVVIASGYSYDGEVKKAMDKGAIGYVSKPYRLADLLKTVRGALDKPV